MSGRLFDDGTEPTCGVGPICSGVGSGDGGDGGAEDEESALNAASEMAAPPPPEPAPPTPPTVEVVPLTMTLPRGTQLAPCQPGQPISVPCDRGAVALDESDGELTAFVEVCWRAPTNASSSAASSPSSSASSAAQASSADGGDRFDLTCNRQSKGGVSAANTGSWPAGDYVFIYTAQNSAGLVGYAQRTVTFAATCDAPTRQGRPPFQPHELTCDNP